MSYQKIVKKLLNQGYDRVERDDRLVDVFPLETSEKGIELWQKWVNKNVFLVRIHEPMNPQSTAQYTISKAKIEQALRSNIRLILSKFKIKNQRVGNY